MRYEVHDSLGTEPSANNQYPVFEDDKHQGKWQIWWVAANGQHDCFMGLVDEEFEVSDEDVYLELEDNCSEDDIQEGWIRRGSIHWRQCVYEWDDIDAIDVGNRLGLTVEHLGTEATEEDLDAYCEGVIEFGRRNHCGSLEAANRGLWALMGCSAVLKYVAWPAGCLGACTR